MKGDIPRIAFCFVTLNLGRYKFLNVQSNEDSTVEVVLACKGLAERKQFVFAFQEWKGCRMLAGLITVWDKIW